MVAYPDRGEGNDPEPFFFFFFFFFLFRGVGSLSQPRLNIFTVGNMRVMICLGQGGLRSLSASSFLFIYFCNLLILKHPDDHQTLIGSLLSYLGPIRKISLQSVLFLVMLLTNRHTNQHHQNHSLLLQNR